jgi:hypothetical protein
MNCICCDKFYDCPFTKVPRNIFYYDEYGGIACDYYLPTWITPEEYHNRTGKDWPENWAVYARYIDKMGNDTWYCEAYEPAQYTKNNPVAIVCALASGPPPIDFEPINNEGEKI